MDLGLNGELSRIETIAVTWTEAMADPLTDVSFAVCVANDGCDDLTVGMLYRVLPDESAAAESLLRIIDDSGEDYLYPASRFVAVAAAEAERPRLLAASTVNVA